jgi:hypothetical protein
MALSKWDWPLPNELVELFGASASSRAEHVERAPVEAQVHQSKRSAPRSRARREGYGPALQSFIAPKNDIWLSRHDALAVEAEFERELERQAEDGMPVPELPKDRRHLRRRIAQIRAQREGAIRKK